MTNYIYRDYFIISRKFPRRSFKNFRLKIGEVCFPYPKEESFAFHFSVEPSQLHCNGNSRDLVSLVPSISREVPQTICLLRQFSSGWRNAARQQSVWRVMLTVLNSSGINNSPTWALSSRGVESSRRSWPRLVSKRDYCSAWRLTSRYRVVETYPYASCATPSSFLSFFNNSLIKSD